MARFADKGTKDIHAGTPSKAARKTLPMILWPQAKRKLDLVLAATRVSDLQVPPANHLEYLPHGPFAGYYSIRINNQYRICFRWTDDGAQEIEIVDYH